MAGVARKDDETSCPQLTPWRAPHLGGPLENAMDVCLQINGRPVIRLGDYGKCINRTSDDVVFEGAALVTICGLPVARIGDAMVHGGLIIQGSPNVDIGGPAFSLPENITVVGPATYQNEVIRDLYFLSTTDTGREIFRGIEEDGFSVTIEPTADNNSYAAPISDADAINGTGTGTRIQYNPSVTLRIQDDTGAWHPMPPQALIAHELIHAYHNANGTNATNTQDPNAPVDLNAPATTPPTLVPLPLEEAQTIGTGSYGDGDPAAGAPTENSLRDGLGLPRRDNWYFNDLDDAGNPLTAPELDLRPGEC